MFFSCVYLLQVSKKVLNMLKILVYPAWIIFIPAYAHWKHVVIVFVAELTCCILVILIVYYVIRACNISDERSANVTQQRRREPSHLLINFVLYPKASRMIRTVIHIVSRTHTCSYLLGTYIFMFISRKNRILYDRVDSNCVPPIRASV